MTPATVPVVIEEEAARRIARLQLQREMEQMIAWVQENVPGLRGIRVVSLRDRPSRNDKVVIKAYWDDDGTRPHRKFPEFDFIEWKLANFHWLVGQKVSVWCEPGPMPG